MGSEVVKMKNVQHKKHKE